MSHSCMVKTCRKQNCLLFPVPRKGSKVYNKWNKLLKLEGMSKQRICADQFTARDFINVTSRQLKHQAVPSIIPTQRPPIDITALDKEGCSIAGCRTRKQKFLKRLPPITRRKIRLQWIMVLRLNDVSDKSLRKIRVCRRHFLAADLIKKTSRYLKPYAVPTIGVMSKTFYKRRLYISNISTPVSDHNYCTPFHIPRSDVMCSVVGCTAQAGNGIVLHKFPPPNTTIYQKWLPVLKTVERPTQHTRICSRHFLKTDYTASGKRLKKDAFPTRRLIYSQTEQTNVYTRFLPTYGRRTFQLNTSISSESLTESEISSNDNELNSTVIESLKRQSDESIGTSSLTNLEQGRARESYASDEVFPVRGQEPNSSSDILTKCFPSIDSFADDTCHVFELQQKHADNVKCTNTTESPSRSSLTLPHLIQSDRDAIVWTGVASLKQLDAICISVKIFEDQIIQKRFRIHAAHRVILALTKLKQNLSFAALATLFKLSPATVAYYFTNMIHVLAVVLGKFIYWPERDEIQRNIPLCFREKFHNVRCVLDCTEIPMATPKCLNCCIACYSNYKGRRTAKFLIGVTPAGLISFVSQAFGGKASDKLIFNHQNVLTLFDPYCDELMVDKGFNIEQECSQHGIRVHIPPFLRGDQHNPEDAALNEKVAKARIHVERVIQRIKIFGILKSTLDASSLGIIDEIMTVICALVNLSPPILRNDKF